MPIFGTGPKRTDGRTNPQINATIRYLSSPNTISNLSFWFDANDNTTIQLQQGNTSNITGWRSKGNFPIQVSTIAQVAPLVPNNAVLPYTVPNGLNGRQTIFMNGVSSMLQFTSSVNNTTVATNNETTIFTVTNPTNGPTPLFAYDYSFTNRIVAQIGIAGGGTSFFYGNGGGTVLTGGSGGTYFGLGYYQNTFYRRNSDTSIAIKFRGASLASATNTATMNLNSHFGIGGFPGLTSFNNPFPYFNGLPRFFIGNYAEILWYNRGLTDDEIVGVEGYLAKKWGIQNQLRFNHIGVATGPPLMGYRLITYPRLVSNYGLWYDAMDTSTIRDVGGNFPPLLPPNALGVAQWNDKSGNNRNLTSASGIRFNLLGNNFYPEVSPNAPFAALTLDTSTNPAFIGCNISAFFVLRVTNPSFSPLLAFTSSFNAMPNPVSGNPLIVNSNSTFDFTLVYNGTNIGLNRFGIDTANSVVRAPYTGSTALIQVHVNGTQNTIGNVLPSTNMISINGAFLSSSSFYAGNNFNFQYLALFGGFNFRPPQFAMSLNEVAVFYRTLTTPERLLIENQLINKWKLSSNQPVSFINSLPVTSGLFGWYDAYDQTTVLRNSSNNVSMWLDKSGQSNHMSTNLLTYGSNTRSNIYYSSISISTNQLPSLFFPSTFAFMQTSSLITNQSLSTFTMMAVTRGTKIPTVNNRTVTFFSTLNDLERAGATIGVPFDQVTNTNITVNQNLSNYSTFHINTLLANIGPTTDTGIASGNAVTYFNGSNSNLGTGLIYNGMLTPRYVRLMASAFTDEANGDPRADAGYLAEVLMYNRILNTTELTNVHTYLLNKWNITPVVSNVPVTQGLNLWLDAYDPSCVITDTTNNVLLWRDKSLFQRNFSNFNNNIGPPTYLNSGMNSLPSVRFTNTFNTNAGQGLINSNFFVSSISSISLFMVKQNFSNINTTFPQAFSMYSTITFNNGNNEFFIFEANTGATSVRRAGTSYFYALNSLLPNITSYIFNSSNTALNDIPASNLGVVFNGIKQGAPVDGLTPSTFNTTIGLLGTNASGIINNNTAYNGYINEVLFYNRALTFVERQQVESYLLCKWNI